MSLEASVWLNSAGLVLDIVGAGLLFKYGLPETLSRTGAAFVVLEQHDQDEIAKAAHYDRMGKLGIRLLIGGFVLQLLSNFV